MCVGVCVCVCSCVSELERERAVASGRALAWWDSMHGYAHAVTVILDDLVGVN